mmetsp:Transcript_46505/g.129632  ORF Transcript_46505/g.129632 Transcript_46505/m.129632 type:complete len:416 (-) Transcript_46505:202-1449(-)
MSVAAHGLVRCGGERELGRVDVHSLSDSGCSASSLGHTVPHAPSDRRVRLRRLLQRPLAERRLARLAKAAGGLPMAAEADAGGLRELGARRGEARGLLVHQPRRGGEDLVGLAGGVQVRPARATGRGPRHALQGPGQSYQKADSGAPGPAEVPVGARGGVRRRLPGPGEGGDYLLRGPQQPRGQGGLLVRLAPLERHAHASAARLHRHRQQDDPQPGPSLAGVAEVGHGPGGDLRREREGDVGAAVPRRRPRRHVDREGLHRRRGLRAGAEARARGREEGAGGAPEGGGDPRQLGGHVRRGDALRDAGERGQGARGVALGPLGRAAGGGGGGGGRGLRVRPQRLPAGVEGVPGLGRRGAGAARRGGHRRPTAEAVRPQRPHRRRAPAHRHAHSERREPLEANGNGQARAAERLGP